MIDFRKNKKDYIEIFNELIIPTYPEAKKILDWLETTDFYTAPASINNHSAEKGGLCYHHLLVYDSFVELFNAFNLELPENVNEADVALMTLGHDYCKINKYESALKPTKKIVDGVVQWEDKQTYVYNEDFIFGHGEKSVYLIMKFINTLPDIVYQAIRYHMGGLESAMVDKNSSPVMAKNRLALLLHLADMYATFGLEERKE